MSSDIALKNWLTLWQEIPDLEFDKGNNANFMIQRFLSLGIERNGEILFPLCGKAKSMIGLAEHGYRIAGIEISPVAISRFFSENQLSFMLEVRNEHPVYIADELPISVFCDDIFNSLPMRCQGLFDVAALVAVLPEQRRRYVDTLKSMLVPGAKGIVAVVEYEGIAACAPFPVSVEEFHALFSESFEISKLGRYEAKVHPMHPLATRKMEGAIYAVELK